MLTMTNPYDESPQTQPSRQTPYTPPGQQYPQGPGQPAPYGQQSPMPYGQQPYGAPPQEHPQGTMILIFGILGIFITIFAPIAWYMGNKARKEIQASGIPYANEQNISIGRMLGKIFTIIAIVSIAVTIVILIVTFGFAASQSGG
jgi:hypothetical protein